MNQITELGTRLQGLTTEKKPTKQVAVKKEVNNY